MTAASNYLENALLDHVLRNTAFTQPSGLFLALYTTDPTDADTGTEVSAGGYARQSITMGAAAAGAAKNTNTLTFTATALWGTITHTGIHDAVSGSNLLFHGPLSPNRLIDDTDKLEFDPNDLTVTFD